MIANASWAAGAVKRYDQQAAALVESGLWRSASLPLAVVLLAAGGFLSGCTTLSQSDCLSADWENMGYEDGQKGLSEARFAGYAEACIRHDIVADPVAYGRGRERGLTIYCTGPNGFEIGRSGQPYQGVCPKHLEDDFISARNLGRNVGRVEQAIDSAESNVRSANQEIREARAWTPSQELDRKLTEFEREHSRNRDQFPQNLERKKRELEALWERLAESTPETDTAGLRSNIRRVEIEIEKLESDHRRLLSGYERRRAEIRADHERSKDRLIANNNAKMDRAIRRRDESEQRKAELETELSGLLETKRSANY